MWEHLLRSIQKTLELVVMFIMGLTTLVVLIGVFYRYVLFASLPWTEELARYLLIWMGFLAAPIALRAGAHVGMQFIKLLVPERIRLGMNIVAGGIVLSFLILVTIHGLYLLRGVSGQLSPALSLPMAWAYAAVPTGCLLMSLEVLNMLIIDFHSFCQLQIKRQGIF